MSGPVTADDAVPVRQGDHPDQATIEITESRGARVGALRVRRALPRRARRMIGAWCFADHMGPAAVTEDQGIDIGPHPHTGLQTVTWLLEGEILHRDSLGSEQVIRPGQLNLMTAGQGVAHSEEHTGRYRGDLHGVQLWVAQPEATRHGEPAFEHHPHLPRLDLDGGSATVLVGDLDGSVSPARRDTDHVGADLALHGPTTLPLAPGFEYGLVVFEGAVTVQDRSVGPGHLAYLGSERDEIGLTTTGPARALLVGGMPFDEEILMWWNFVARTGDEIAAAHRQWAERGERFGTVASPLAPIGVDPPPWRNRETTP